jgi:hypothetical protein
MAFLDIQIGIDGEIVETLNNNSLRFALTIVFRRFLAALKETHLAQAKESIEVTKRNNNRG